MPKPDKGVGKVSQMINNPSGVNEIQCRSDMVTLLDAALSALDENRYVLLVGISKKGETLMEDAGFCTELEMKGLKAAVCEFIGDTILERYGCMEQDEEEQV